MNKNMSETIFKATMNKYAGECLTSLGKNVTTILTNPIGAIATTTIVLGTMYFVNDNIKDKRQYKYDNKEAKAEY